MEFTRLSTINPKNPTERRRRRLRHDDDVETTRRVEIFTAENRNKFWGRIDAAKLVQEGQIIISHGGEFIYIIRYRCTRGVIIVKHNINIVYVRSVIGENNNIGIFTARLRCTDLCRYIKDSVCVCVCVCDEDTF